MINRKKIRILAHLRRKTPQTGLFASIFFAADGKKGFPLQSLAPHGLFCATRNFILYKEANLQA
jgi:hypothetical protein